ncbi:MAG: RNA polymerase sigma factor [Solirubrobacterales bacterium]
MGDEPHQLQKAALDRAFTELYRAHLRDVYSFLYYRLGNHHDAEDVSEQVFLQAYRHLPKALAEADGRSLRPWLIRIAQNLAINLYRDRSRKPQAPLEAAGEFADGHDTEDLVASREALAHVFERVSELPDDRREALIMRFALGMDNDEIARAIGKSAGATKVLLHRAVKQLGAQLNADEAASDAQVSARVAQPNAGNGVSS